MSKIYVIGSINEDAYRAFSEEVDKLLQKRNSLIEVELVSAGGTFYDGLAFCGKIRSSPATFSITAHGLCHSAATLVLASGDIRQASSEISFMVHETVERMKGSSEYLVAQAQRLLAQELDWEQLMEECTGTPADVWRTMSKKTTYFGAQEALQFNLINKILKPKRKSRK